MTYAGLLSFALCATLIAGCSRGKGENLGRARNAEPATVGTSGATDIARQDAQEFIHHLAIVNRAEIDLGKLAESRGTADDVKKFAQMMVDDHTASGVELRKLSSDLRIDASGEPDDKHLDQRDTLAKRNGADFDREYASAMVDGHSDLIDQLEARIDKKTLEQLKLKVDGKSGVAPEPAGVLPDQSANPTTMRVNQFAAHIYPMVRAHLESARSLKDSLAKR